MKCPNCGADMTEDSLYCENCGKDIHIVPDYDPELESNIMESIGYSRESKETLMEEAYAEAYTESHAESHKDVLSAKEIARHNRERFVKIAFRVCAAGLCLAVCIGVFCLWQHFSYEYQLNRAASCMAQSRYEEAIDYYLRALELDTSDVEVVFSLAEAYIQKGNKIEYEYLLRQIIRSSSCSQEQLERAYGKLIVIYKEREEYSSINEILQLSGNEAIQNAYQAYLASPPSFSYEEGYYDKAVPLKLTSATIGRIYYTTDGSEPDSSSSLYTAPILIDKPNTVIKAVAVNEYGVYSSVVSKTYDVEIEMVEAPEISVISGTYYVPMMIEVVNADDREVYYTTDGTQPTLNSSLYTGPIPMPLGRSKFWFAYVDEEGNCGYVAKRSYNLKLSTAVTKEEAEQVVVECMLALNKIYNAEGAFSMESAAKYLYKYQYVMTIGDGDYYVIAEIYMDEKNVQNKTGSYYAVNVNEKKCCKLVIDGNNNYSLVEILIDSQNEG